jgi:hypothetical protein
LHAAHRFGYSPRRMKRRAIVITWLLGSAVPLVLTVAWVGCCVLPLHGMVHKLMPLCEMAEQALSAHHHGGEDHDHPSTPAPQKQDQQDGPGWVRKIEPRSSVQAALTSWSVRAVPPSVAQRSQTAPGAFRCDDDVGTRLALLDTLRI